MNNDNDELKMTSKLMHDDMEMLLKMEMKLRLLEAEGCSIVHILCLFNTCNNYDYTAPGLTLPSEPPPVPRPPPDLPPQFIK